VSPVKYELGFTSQKTTFFTVTAVETLNLTLLGRMFIVARIGILNIIQNSLINQI
jgi:hypothetical protein